MKEVDDSALQGIYRELAGIIGVDATIAVYNELKGQQVTFPTRLYERGYVIKEVNTEYDGSNLKELARKFNYTERWMRTFIKNNDIKEQIDSCE